MTKWTIELQEYHVEGDTKEEALKKYQQILKALSECHVITKPEEIFTNPGLDEYVLMWEADE